MVTTFHVSFYCFFAAVWPVLVDLWPVLQIHRLAKAGLQEQHTHTHNQNNRFLH
jgi:uncharacterized membrane protein YagU involved in acid resistance